MKKIQILTLIAIIALVFSCKKEDEIIGYRFTYDDFSSFLGSTSLRTFLFLFNENGELLQDKEATNNQMIELVAEKDGKYNVGVFQERGNSSFDNKNGFNYDLVHQVPNGKKWDFNSNDYILRGNAYYINTNITIENLPNFDSLYIRQSFSGLDKVQPIYDATKKELIHSSFWAFVDYAYLCVREHKDSSFRYELVKRSTTTAGSVTNFKFDYAKLRKAKTINFKPKDNMQIRNIVALTDKGYFNLYHYEYYLSSASNEINLILPEEKIISYYVEALFSDKGNNVIFYDKVNELNSLILPESSKVDVYPQTNGTNIYKITGKKPVMVENFSSKINSNSRVGVTEILPYENDNSINRPIISIPKVALDNFKELVKLDDSYNYLQLHSFKDKTIDYQTFIEKLFDENLTYGKFNTWAYDVGWIMNIYY